MTSLTTLPDVYSVDEIAQAAGVRPRDVGVLASAGVIQPLLPDGRFYAAGEAVTAVRALKGGADARERPLFRPSAGTRRQPGMP